MAEPLAAAPPGAGSVSEAGEAGEEYFESLVERFAAAAAVAARSSRDVGVAGTRTTIALAGPALGRVLLPALAHLELPPGPAPDLTVLAFDTASTGVAPPAPPAADAASEGGVFRVLQRGAGLFSMLHRERALAVLWTEDAAAVPWNEIAAPLRMIWQPWLAERGWQLVHAAAVGTEAGGALIVGRSGAGKSTTALACLEAGLDFAGDDYVLARAAPEPAAHGLYASAKLQEEQLPRFPSLAAAVANRERGADEKPVLLLAESHRQRLRAHLPLRAVLVPRVTGTARPTLRPVAAAEALAALAPSTLFQLPFGRAAALARLRAVVEALPCYRLETGPDLAAVAAAVRRLLEEGA